MQDPQESPGKDIAGEAQTPSTTSIATAAKAGTSPDPSASDDSEETRFRGCYRDAPYYSTGRNWHDYAPAYHYGHVAHDAHPGARFESVERELAENWDMQKAKSRLVWTEARGAVRDIWKHLDEANPRPR